MQHQPASGIRKKGPPCSRTTVLSDTPVTPCHRRGKQTPPIEQRCSSTVPGLARRTLFLRQQLEASGVPPGGVGPPRRVTDLRALQQIFCTSLCHPVHSNSLHFISSSKIERIEWNSFCAHRLSPLGDLSEEEYIEDNFEDDHSTGSDKAEYMRPGTGVGTQGTEGGGVPVGTDLLELRGVTQPAVRSSEQYRGRPIYDPLTTKVNLLPNFHKHEMIRKIMYYSCLYKNLQLPMSASRCYPSSL